MAIRLIAVDVDGTLLDSQGRLAEETRRAVAEAAEAGVFVALGTGRALDECAALLQALPELRYVIGCTGASVCDARTGKELFADPLPLPLVRELYRKLEPIDCLLELMSEGHVYVEPARLARAREYDTMYYLDTILASRTPAELGAMLDSWDRPVSKIHLFCRDAAECDRARALVPQEGLLVLSSIPQNLEINTATASKGVGLRMLAQHLGLRREETMAIGDNVNDAGMLREAGYPTVVANANPAVLPLARYRTESNDACGVANAIRRVLRGEVEEMRREEV